MVAFDPETGATRGTRAFADDLATTGTLGHPHWDPSRDEMVNLGVRYGFRCEYVLHRRERGSATREVVGRAETDRPSYVHSFAITERYVVFAESPLVLSPRALLEGGPFVEALEWVPTGGLNGPSSIAGPVASSPGPSRSLSSSSTTSTRTRTATNSSDRGRRQGVYPGEAVFVAEPGAEAEDAGTLLSVVLDADAERSFLLVVDAATFDERARAPLPHALPFGFHGQFVRNFEDPTRSMA